jgi:GST-like protein
MLKFYFSPAPNPMKVALFLEESGLPYEAIPVDTRKGEQHSAQFLSRNPNAKLPVINDDGAIVFDSNAILLYLGEKTGQFMPGDSSNERGQLLSWLMFIASGIGPYSGQAVHFNRYAPEPMPYAKNRYDFEAERHFGIVEQRLAENQYMVGSAYSIVDMALWGWARILPVVMGEQAWASFPNLKRLVDEITARPAAVRAVALPQSHTFKTEMDAESERAMFPGNARLAN